MKGFGFRLQSFNEGQIQRTTGLDFDSLARCRGLRLRCLVKSQQRYESLSREPKGQEIQERVPIYGTDVVNSMTARRLVFSGVEFDEI